jgi:hypothetical protein
VLRLARGGRRVRRWPRHDRRYSLHRWSHAERLTCAADAVLPAVE